MLMSRGAAGSDLTASGRRQRRPSGAEHLSKDKQRNDKDTDVTSAGM